MKNTCAAFIKILNTINNEGIHTRQKLMENQELYTNFWYAAEHFVSFALHSKTSKKNKEGEITSGNIAKIEKLVECGITTEKDIHSDCVIKIIDKLDLILNQQPINKQYNYCYTICNNLVNDQFKLLPPKGIKLISLQESIDASNEDEDYTYADAIGDFTYNGETCYIEQESICELSVMLKEKRDAEQAKERANVVNEIKLLATKPAEVLVHMACSHLNLKPRELAAHIVDNGVEETYTEVLFEVSKKVGLELTELYSYVKGNKLSEESVKADTKNASVVASQISRLVYRANKKINK